MHTNTENGSGKTSLFVHDSRFDFLTIKLSGLFLLAAFPKHSGSHTSGPGLNGALASLVMSTYM